MENNNKKTLILSIIGILVLVIAVVGVSFAMYSFTGTGSKENIIKAGTITLDFGTNDNVIALDNEYPMSDARGVDLANRPESAKADFTVNADWGQSKMQVNYDLGLTDITPGATLTAEYVKIALLDEAGKVLVGEGTSTLTSGVTVASLESAQGPNGLITNYGLTGNTFTANGTHSYTILAYVSDAYDLPTDTANTTENVKKTTASESFSFKLTVSAAQQVATAE